MEGGDAPGGARRQSGRMRCPGSTELNCAPVETLPQG
jgi:hypothetical protein